MAGLQEHDERGGSAQPPILLVDDEANQREMYKHRLERAGYEVRLADSAQAAVEAVADQRPEVVVLDIAMPERDGLSVLHELLDRDPSLPVIINTAYPAYADDFLAWAAEAYVEKSSDMGPLLQAIEQSLARAQAQ
jgi:two-component system response regulator (stage 0 sporulation protein F)